ncbi:hypothetical protein Bbelb_402640 [Branchiostoma belcheri]|nr:hypothetical protein Bbelb_402640 [Branchiostoma belcheri]
MSEPVSRSCPLGLQLPLGAPGIEQPSTFFVLLHVDETEEDNRRPDRRPAKAFASSAVSPPHHGGSSGRLHTAERCQGDGEHQSPDIAALSSYYSGLMLEATLRFYAGQAAPVVWVKRSSHDRDRLANRSGTLQTRPGPRGNHGTRNIDNSLPSLQNRLHKYRLPQPAPRYGEIGVPRDTPGLGLTTDHPASPKSGVLRHLTVRDVRLHHLSASPRTLGGFAVINDSTELLVRTQEPDGLPPSSPPDCGQDVPCDSGSRIDTRWPPRAVSPAQISQQ